MLSNFLKPKVLFVGPPRTGTTWIWKYLTSRGDVVLPEGVKETWFFSIMYHKGVNWYFSHFKSKQLFRIVAEVDPTLFTHPQSPQRVRDILGSDVLIVVNFRDPIERSISHYYHALSYGWIKKGSLEEAIQNVPDIIEASLYSKYIPCWVSIFGKKQVALLSHKVLATDPETFVQQICKVMNLPYIKAPPHLLQKKVYKRRYPRFGFLSQCVKIVSKVIRDHRLYPLWDIGKRIGMRKILYREIDSDENIHQLRNFIKEALHQEYNNIKELLKEYGLTV